MENSAQQEDQNTLIDLSKISDAKSFELKELIQKDAREIFIYLLSSFLKDARAKNDTNVANQKNINCFEFERCHNTIFIDGQRGTGKTSFALSMRKYIRENPDNYKIADLCIMDPTIAETKEHIFINIIMRIVRMVESSAGDKYRETFSDKIQGHDNLFIWKKYQNKLAKGLSLLDGVGGDNFKKEIWDFPELIMEEGLKNARSGEELEFNFRCFIKESLRILEKDAFILFLDDIDTSADKGIIILEILRKYMTHKEFIIVLIGDIGLYSLLARQLQWKKIDLDRKLKDYENIGDKEEKNKIDSECEKYTEENIYIKYINNLQDQYLVKILKPENRIFLKSIDYYKDKIFIQFKLKYEAQKDMIEDKTKSLRDFLKDNFIKDVFHTSERDVDIYEEYICSLPHRSFLQLLLLWDKYLKDKNKNKDKDKKERLNFIINIKSLLQVYLLDMDDYDFINPDAILINRLSKYLLEKMNCIETIYDFLPVYISKTDNAKVFFLNAVFANYLHEKKYKLLEYFVKIGFVKKCLEEYKKQSNRYSVLTDTATKMISNIGLDSHKTLSIDIARKATEYFQGSTTNPNSVNFGYIHISKEKYDKIKKSYKDDNRIIFLYAILSITKNLNAGEIIHGSFFTLLGLISDILCIKGENIKDEEIHEEICKKIGEKFSDIISYNCNNDESDKNAEEFLKDDCVKELIKYIAQWVNLSDKIEPLAIPYLNRIWKRFIDNEEYLAVAISKEENETSFNTFNKVLHRYIISFLNAVLVETVSNKKFEGSEKLIIKNPIKDDKVFDDYFKKIEFLKQDRLDGDDTPIDLFNFIFSCPLWGLYLDNIYQENGLPESVKYYYKIQNNFFNNQNKLQECYKKFNIKNISTEISIENNQKSGVKKSERQKIQKQKKNFKELNENEQIKLVRRVIELDGLSIEDVKSRINDPAKHIDFVMSIANKLRNVFKDFKYVNVAKGTVEKILNEL